MGPILMQGRMRVFGGISTKNSGLFGLVIHHDPCDDQ